MSDKKQVIHVRDLVIKADNVYIEPTHHQHRDPFFGPTRRREDDVESSNHKELDFESSENKDRDERRPFSWF